MRVVDLMTSDVITVTRDASLKEAARTMVRNRVSGIPVVEKDGSLCGMVTEGDFLRLEVERGVLAEAPSERPLAQNAGTARDDLLVEVIEVILVLEQPMEKLQPHLDRCRQRRSSVLSVSAPSARVG